MIPITKDLSKEHLNQIKRYIKQQEWYRQVGDVTFVYLAVTCFGVLEELPFQSFIMQGKTFEGYYPTRELAKKAKAFLEKNRTTTKFIDDHAQLMANHFAVIKNAVKSFEGMDTLPLEKVQKKIHVIDKRYYQIWLDNAFLADEFDTTGNELLQEEIKNHDLSLSHEEIAKLIRPVDLTYIEAERLDLLSLPVEKKALETHTKKWKHVKNSLLQAMFPTMDDFRKERKACKDPLKEKEVLKKLEEQTKKQIQTLYKKYKVPQEMKNVFHMFRTLSAVRDARKEIMMVMVELYASYTKRLAKEFGIQPGDVDNATTEEILTLQTKKDVETLLSKLKKRESGILLTKYQDKLYFLTEAKEIMMLLPKKLLETYKELKGMVSCKTDHKKIKGKVR